jgi:asparagine synthase (glutamine-hydrolysing)
MAIICGWLGSQQESGRILAENMLRSVRGTPEESVDVCVTDSAALARRGSPSSPVIDHGDGILAVIEGNPQWQDEDLSRLAEKNPSKALAEGFRRHGKGILERLSGAFSLCILKPAEQYALLAVDRVGIRPMAYTSGDGVLVFGSLIDSILGHPSISAEVSPQGLYNYLYFQMIPSPGSIYKGIEKLQPGECLEASGGTVNRRFYHRLEFSEHAVPEQELASQLRAELNTSVSTLLPDRATGTFLSGGLDSSTVTGVYQSLIDNPVNAFAIGFDAEGFDEMEYARASADHFGATLHEYYVTPDDVLQAIPLVASAYDEPFGNASAIPAYYCAKFAREKGISCLLAGDGGDEIFAGNARYAKQKMFDLYRHIPGILKTYLIEPAAFHLPPLKKLKSYIVQALVPMPERMETYNFLHRTPLEEIFDPDFLHQIDSRAPIEHLSSVYNRADSDTLVKKMLFLDHKITLADNDLRKVNRMCELAGMEVRYPLLQDSMMEFAARVPADILLKRFELRYFFRNALKDFLAPQTLDKSKHGFGLPFGLWLHEHPPLREFADNSLKRIKQLGILKKEYIEQIIKAHESGHATYYGVMIWILVMLEQWLQAHEVRL